MRFTILLSILLGIYSVGMAQKNIKSEKDIEAQIDSFITSWNKHDFSDMKNYIAEDCDFVNIKGIHWKGRENIQFAHQAYHNQFFKNTPIEKRFVTIRLLKPDVAVAHLLWHIGAFTSPSGSKQGDNDDLATIVFVKTKGKWLISAMENVEVNAQAQSSNPVKVKG